MSKTFYLFSIVLIPALFMVASWVVNVEALELDPGPVRAWSMIAAFYGVGIFVLFWYRAWRALYGERAKFKPAQMALLLLLPAFNLYWMFKAVRGWPRAYNSYLGERGLDLPPLDDWPFVAYCAFTVVLTFVNPAHFWKVDFYGGHYVLLFLSQVAKSAQLCFDAWIIWTVCGAVNRLPAREAGAA